MTCAILVLPRPPRSCYLLGATDVSRLAERPRSGLALTRRARPRSWDSEETAPSKADGFTVRRRPHQLRASELGGYGQGGLADGLLFRHGCVIAFSGATCRVVSAGQVGGLAFTAQAAV